MTTEKSAPLALASAYGAAFLTGAAALTYEVVWAKMLVIPLGNSADALAIVLSGFMIGLALGAVLFGSLADRTRFPLRFYAALEGALALYALAMPAFVRLLGTAPTGSFEEAPVLVIFRYGAAFLLVAVPSSLMGASIPVLLRGLSLRAIDISRRIGPLYGLNTLGGATGAALAGFLSIPLVGLNHSSLTGVAMNLFAAALVLSVYRPASKLAAEPVPFHSPAPPEGTRRSGNRGAAALLASASAGFTMLAMETLWARLLRVAFGFDTYAYAVLLVVVLAGLGIGGMLHRTMARRDSALLLSTLLGLLACSVLASFWAAAELFPALRTEGFGLSRSENPTLQLRLLFLLELLYAPVLAFVPSVLAGAAFPAACTLFAGPVENSGHRIGVVGLVNGLGATAGALAAAFLLIPALGVEGTAKALSLLACIVSVAVIFLAGERRGGRLLLPVGTAAVAMLVLFAMPADLPLGMFLFAAGPRHQRLIHYDEGRVNTVAVTQDIVSGEKQLFVNSISEVTTRLVHDQSFKLLGHLGMLMHPDPREVLAICLGGGLSAGAAIQHPLSRIDVVDIDPSVSGATRHFAQENRNLLDDPRFRLHINDGRQFLYSTSRSYDVIQVDSTHPKAADSWLLYTKEFYQLLREHLDDDGVAVQWVPIHLLSEAEFKIIVKSFLEVFPEATLWANVGIDLYGQSAYAKLLGTKKPLAIDYRRLQERLEIPSVRADLAPFGMDNAVEILDSFVAGPEAIGRWLGDVPAQTDDRPLIPYITRHAAGPRMAASTLYRVRTPVLPLVVNMGPEEERLRRELQLAYDAQGLLMGNLLGRAAEVWPEGRKIRLYRRSWDEVAEYYPALAERYWDDPAMLLKIGARLHSWGFGPEAKALLQRAVDLKPGDARALTGLGNIYADLGPSETAVQLLAKALQQDPDSALAGVNLGIVFKRTGKFEEAEEQFERVLKTSGDLQNEARYHLALLHLQRGRLKEAEEGLRASVAENPRFADAWHSLGQIAEKKLDRDGARTYFSKAVDSDPFLADASYRRGNLHLSEEKYDLAIADFTQAAYIVGEFAKAFLNRGVAYAAKGDAEHASRDFSRALEIDPSYAGAYVNRARSYLAMGDYTLAREDVEKAEELGFAVPPALIEQLGGDPREEPRNRGSEAAR